ncbi:TonB-dependent receptor domain-containing protein [Chitinophaga sp. 22321]|uniref:TonB-dependent receptor n=1 Tax=Chitinophaga hostae TaxID=2831022 RepID=A0ABS5J9F3_9BACT|nr:TonB-dependent receptor [Chitinophaga hostae]MBS0031217.1 TonB-dependent receptor [Chitinophaga hostae]
MIRTILIFFLFFCCLSTVFSQQAEIVFKGKILDAQTREQLPGATIRMQEGKRGGNARLDGSFSVDKITAGTYHLQVTYMGYHSLDTVVNIDGKSAVTLLLRSNRKELHTVSVNGKQNVESGASAKKSEQLAGNVMNIVSAKAIQLSPDITIANVLQRVSGVSLERSSSGDGRYAIIRGMDKRYNYTLINGVKIPSPDNKNRYVPLDLFPADLVERVEVNKTLTPNMEGDAIGGTVNMVMKNAPDRLYVNGSLSTGYSQTLIDRPFDYFPAGAINRKSPYEVHGRDYQAQPDDFTRDNLNYTKKSFTPNAIANLSIGNRFFDNKLGVMLGGSYQHTYKGYHSLFNPVDEYQDMADAYGQIYIKHAYDRTYSTEMTRTGLNGKVDYRVNDNNKISLYSFTAILEEAQARLGRDTLQPPPRTAPGLGQVWYQNRSKYQRQSISSTTLQGEHEVLPGRLKLDWSAVYSKANNNIPDLAEYEYDGGFYADGTSKEPYLHPNKVTNYSREWWKNNDRDYAGYLNAAYSGKLADIPFKFSAGGMYRAKHRDNFHQKYDLDKVIEGNQDFQLWTDIYHFKWTVSNPAGSPDDGNNYRADENIAAGYAMLKFTVKKLETIIGARLEHTDQSYETDAPPTMEATHGSITYSDIMPSVHFKYMLNERTNLRLSYFSSISRPAYFELIPFGYQGDDYTEKGNAFLKHTTADNFDLRYEFFPKPDEQILIGAFYKKLKNPIEYGFVFTGVGNDKVYQPGNFGDATNFGFEVVYEKYISNFGVRVNYTYTNSSIETSKLRTFNRVTVSPAPLEKRPLQGQSANVANAALLYKNPKIGLDMQLNWQLTGKRIALVSPYYGYDYWQKDMNQFDLSAEKKIGQHFAIFAKVQNLLNTPYELYIKGAPSNTIPLPKTGNDETLIQKDVYGQNYQLGVRFVL